MTFDRLYRSLDAVAGFGRTARYDFLRLLGLTGLAEVWPGRCYLDGSFSLKAVLTAVRPDVAYEDLEIRSGMVASNAYLDSIGPGTETRDRNQLRRDLLAYCARDTMAMLLIIGAMRGERPKMPGLAASLGRVTRSIWPYKEATSAVADLVSPLGLRSPIKGLASLRAERGREPRRQHR